MSAALTVAQATEIWTRYHQRRERFPVEEPLTSFLVVVLNYGDHLTPVSCIGGEWTGTKGDATAHSATGIPLCPSNHPLLEGRERQRLGLVDEVL
jgi:hypothetical protein